MDDLCKRCKTVCRARCIRHNLVRRVVCVQVDAAHKHRCVCRRRTDDHCRSAAYMRCLYALPFKDAGCLHHIVCTGCAPWNACRIALCIDGNRPAVDNKCAGRCSNSPGIAAVDRVVLEHVCHVLSTKEGVVDGDDVEVAVEECVAQDNAADAAKAAASVRPQAQPYPLMPMRIAMQRVCAGRALRGHTAARRASGQVGGCRETGLTAGVLIECAADHPESRPADTRHCAGGPGGAAAGACTADGADPCGAGAGARGERVWVAAGIWLSVLSVLSGHWAVGEGGVGGDSDAETEVAVAEDDAELEDDDGRVREGGKGVDSGLEHWDTEREEGEDGAADVDKEEEKGDAADRAVDIDVVVWGEEADADEERGEDADGLDGPVDGAEDEYLYGEDGEGFEECRGGGSSGEGGEAFGEGPFLEGLVRGRGRGIRFGNEAEDGEELGLELEGDVEGAGDVVDAHEDAADRPEEEHEGLESSSVVAEVVYDDLGDELDTPEDLGGQRGRGRVAVRCRLSQGLQQAQGCVACAECGSVVFRGGGGWKRPGVATQKKSEEPGRYAACWGGVWGHVNYFGECGAERVATAVLPWERWKRSVDWVPWAESSGGRRGSDVCLAAFCPNARCQTVLLGLFGRGLQIGLAGAASADCLKKHDKHGRRFDPGRAIMTLECLLRRSVVVNGMQYHWNWRVLMLLILRGGLRPLHKYFHSGCANVDPYKVCSIMIETAFWTRNGLWIELFFLRLITRNCAHCFIKIIFVVLGTLPEKSKMTKKDDIFDKYDSSSSSNKILLELEEQIKNNDITPSEVTDMLIHAFEEIQANDFINAETLETLGKKEGFECFQDKYENGVTLSLGGKIIVIDIDLEKFPIYWKVVRVTTTWADSSGGQYFSPSTDAILLSNFSKSYRLNSFKSNFQRLTCLDRLSSPPTWDLFSIIRSLHLSLKKIYDYELEIYFDAEKVLCEKSGKPEFDVANIVGLSLWYWKQRHCCFVEHKSWRVIIEAQENDPSLFSISSAFNIEWTNQKVDLLDNGYEWITSSSNSPSSSQFVMILDPPLVICLEDIKKICKIIGLNDTSIFFKDVQNDNDLVYETVLTSQSLPIHAKRTIYLPSSLTQDHFYIIEKSTLFPVCVVKRIPFYHPEHIYFVLKILRKYTVLQTLVESYMNDDTCKNFLLDQVKYKTSIKSETNINITTFYEKDLGIEISFSTIYHNLKIKLSIIENGHIILKDIQTNRPLFENMILQIEQIFQVSEDLGISCEYIRQMLEKENYLK
ncbi:hypothetical protein PMAC_001492 [Pneumocystis sp. 'macacae']|nr:hypothetical protein PMAC_001492 [Pneumocystis sp. 'macacae']